MDKGQMLKDLPTDILLKIQSYLLGEPDYLKIKRSNTLKRLQSKFFTKQLSNSMTINGFPSWEWYVYPPRHSTTVRRVITYHLKNQVHQIKALIDNPDYFNDGGILLEVEYYNPVGFLQKKRIIPSEDKIETVMASICKDYIDDDIITDIDRKYTLQHLRIELHTSRQVIENKTRRRRRRRNQ